MSNLLITVLVLVLFWGTNLIIQNKKNLLAKIMNLGIMMIVLLYLINNGLFYLTSLLYDAKRQFLSEYVKTGALSPTTSLLIYVVGLVISLVFAITVIGTVGLRNKFRLWMLRILPFYILLEFLNLYKISIREFDYFNTNVSIAIGGVMVSLVLIIYIIYSRPFMIRCFKK